MTVQGTFYRSIRDANARVFRGGEHADNSPDCFSTRTIGALLTNEIAFTAAGATTNIFLVTGLVRIFGIGGIFTDVTDVADVDAMARDFHDGAAGVGVTAAAGTTCDGVGLNARLLKVAAAGTAITLLDSDAAAIDETDPKRLLTPFLLSAKEGASNYIRFTYTSAGGCDAAVLWFVEWRHVGRHSDGLVTAV